MEIEIGLRCERSATEAALQTIGRRALLGINAEQECDLAGGHRVAIRISRAAFIVASKALPAGVRR
jgi:hypothetical protein